MPRHALWGSLYFASAVAIAGLPPLSGFIGKFLILRASPGHPVVWAAILIGALVGVIALARAGSRLFFHNKLPESVTAYQSALPPVAVPGASPRELIPIVGLLAMIAGLTVAAGPIFDFARATAAQLSRPERYVNAVTSGQGDEQ